MIDGLTGAVPVYPWVQTAVASSESTGRMYPALQNVFVPDGLVIDIKKTHDRSVKSDVAIAGGTGFDAARRDLVFLNSSAQEHAVWEELVNAESFSSVKSLQLARQRGIPVLTIDPSNAASLFPTLRLAQPAMQYIQNELARGSVVTVPRDPTPLNDWQGVGFTVRRTDGSGGAIIFGTLRGQPLAGGVVTGNPAGVPVVDPNTAQSGQAYVGDPINIANGNVAHDEADIALPGVGMPLEFSRRYDSRNGVDRGMGPGWSFSYGDRLTRNADGSVTWFDAGGSHLRFTPNGAGGFVTPDSIFGSFSGTSTSGYTWRDKTGTVFEWNAAGRLSGVRDRYGNGVVVTYNGSEIGTVSDRVTPSRKLTFTYAGGRVASITDFTGRTWAYEYVSGLLAKVTAPSDAGTAQAVVRYDYFTDPARNGLLRQVTQPDGGKTTYAYYANRRGFQVTDPEGFTHSLSYNTFRDRAAFTDERGNTTRYTHNADANLVAVVYPDMASESWTWSKSLRQSWTDALGHTATFTYDTLGNLKREVDRAGFTTDLEYSPSFSNVTKVTRPGGRFTQFAYDAGGNLTQVTDAEGNRTTMTYDGRGQVRSQTRPKGNQTATVGDFTTTFTYNAAGQVLTQSTDLPATETFAYNTRGDQTSHTDANGHATTFGYDLLGRPVRRTDALGHAATMAYDSMGNLVSARDELGRTETFSYDRRQLHVATRNKDGTTSRTVYDGSRNVQRGADELGRTTVYWLDARNRPTASLFADGSAVTTDFDGQGRVAATVDGRRNRWRSTYDKVDRLLTTVDPKGGATARSYDGVGNMLSFREELGWTTAYTYDRLDRQKTVDDPLRHITTMAYDADGNLASLTDPLNHTVTYGYDVLDRRTSVTDALGRPTASRYDPGGNLKSYTDPAGNVTSYGYDVLDRRTTETVTPGLTRTFTHDDVGNVLSAKDRNGRVRTFAYDKRDRQVREQWLGASNVVVYSLGSVYDAAGQMVLTGDPNATYTYSYDSVGRTKSVDNAGTPGIPAVRLAYTYDPNGNTSSVSDSIDGAAKGTETRRYDALDRLDSITQTGTGVSGKRATFQYDAASQLKRVDRSADAAGTLVVATSVYNYDAAARLTALSHTRGTTTIAQYAWTFDNADRITRQTSPDGTTTYAYDNTDQLTSADHSSQQDESYAYDRNGNRTNPGYVTGANNRLSADGKFTFEYDNEGNRRKTTEIASRKTVTYEWDHRNRLTRMVSRDAAGKVVNEVSFAYDMLGRRLARTADADGVGPGAATSDRFVYVGDHIALQFDGSGKLTHRYLYGPGVDNVLADEAPGGGVLWLMSDHQGTVRDVVSSAGVVQSHLKYDSFGRVTAESNPAVRTLFAYTGRERDTATGLYYYRARYYDPGAGRFISEDPSSFAAGDPNLYRYVGNGAVGKTDPSGLREYGGPAFGETLMASAASLLGLFVSFFGVESV